MSGKIETMAKHLFVIDPGHLAGHDVFDRTSPERYQASRRVTRISILVNILLSVGQVTIGVIGQSQALVADGVHTLSDIITDLMVLFALKQGAKAADVEHPYGHGRIETAVTVVLGVILIGVAVGIALNAGLRLADPARLPIPSALTLWVAVTTILSKEGLYRFTLYTARRYRSNLLRANAWHHRSDAISSIIVLLGIAGSRAGLPYLDGIAAVGVAMMVAKIGWDLGRSAVKELVDTALDAEEVDLIKKTILSVDGVKSLHLLRTRRTGGQALVDVHIIVDGTISVSEGHHISETVRSTLIDEIDTVTDVTVHIDSEDDEIFARGAGLPLRREVLERLRQRFRHIDAAGQIDDIRLHYLNGKIHVELLLPVKLAAGTRTQTTLLNRFREAVRDDPLIGSLELRFH